MYAIHYGNGSPTPDQRVFRYVSPIDGSVTEFHAERGMVSLYWEKNGKEFFHRETRVEFVLRMIAFALQGAKRDKYPIQRKRTLDLVEMMRAVNRLAREQGDPLSSRAVADMRKAALPCRVSLAGTAQPHHYLHSMPQADPAKPYVDMSDSPAARPESVIITAR